jgi:hypothetical protein
MAVDPDLRQTLILITPSSSSDMLKLKHVVISV